MRYPKFLTTTFALALIVAVTMIDGRADAQKTNGLSKSDVEKIVRDFLIANPEVIQEVIQALQAKREAAENTRTKAAMAMHGDALRAHPMTPVSGNTLGDVTVVEFFDYQCGYCKRSLASMIGLLKSDKNVRVIWKELPILGPASRFAARAAMAAKKQGKYFDLHAALMSARGRLTEQKVMDAAKDVGLKVTQLRADMKDPTIEVYLNETQQLATALGIRGTPAFVIGDTLVPGALDEAGMKQIIAQMRAGGKITSGKDVRND